MEKTKRINYFLLILLLLSAMILVGCTSSNTPGKNKKSNKHLITITGDIKSGAVYNELSKYGIQPLEILQLAHDFKPIYNLSGVDSKDKFKLTYNSNQQIIKFRLEKSDLESYIATRTTSDAFSVYQEPVFITKTKKLIETTISSTVYESILDSGGSDFLAMTFFNIFAWDIDFVLDPRPGDKITILYEQNYKDDKPVGYAKILAAKYEGKERSADAYPYILDGGTKFFDHNGHSLRKMFLRMPLNFGVITSYFSNSRFHPVLKYTRAHTGIDYGAPYGATILSTADGFVSFAGRKGGYGNLVIIQHVNGYKTYYGHCSSFLVKQGQRVRQGQGIAKVGSTGMSTGPHVHYEVRLYNISMNPLLLKSTKGAPIPSNKKAVFLNNVVKSNADIKNLENKMVVEAKKINKKRSLLRTLFALFV